MPSSPVPSLTGVFDLLLDAVCLVDREGRFVMASAACERIFGYTPAEMAGRVMLDMVAPEHRERTLNEAQRVMAGQPLLQFENVYIRKDGRRVHIMWSASWSEPDQLRIAVARDISASKRTGAIQAALYAISEAAHGAHSLGDLLSRIHRTVAGLMPAPGFAVALIDAAGAAPRVVYQSPAHADLPAGPAMLSLYAEVARRRTPLVVTPATRHCLPPHLQGAPGTDANMWLGVPLAVGRQTIGVLAMHSGPHGAPYADDDQEVLLFVSAQIAAAIQRRQLHEQLQQLALRDELTGLANRRLLTERIDQALARARRRHGVVGLVYLDLNQFKQINDVHGHAGGDAVLREVGRRLLGCVRAIDTVARVGGDEFVVLLARMLDRTDVDVVVQKIDDVLHPPVTLDNGVDLLVRSSLGVALYPEHGADGLQLLRHADEAMYADKLRLAAARDARARDRVQAVGAVDTVAPVEL